MSYIREPLPDGIAYEVHKAFKHIDFHKLFEHVPLLKIDMHFAIIVTPTKTLFVTFQSYIPKMPYRFIMLL